MGPVDLPRRKKFDAAPGRIELATDNSASSVETVIAKPLAKLIRLAG